MDSPRLKFNSAPLSPVGYGAFKIGRNQKIKYDAPYELPSDADSARLLNQLVDAGINYFDTAPAYGLSEQRLGTALASRRHEIFLSTKVGETFADGQSTYDFSPAALAASAAHSLRRLQTDAVDCLFLHSPGDDIALLTPEVVAALERLREAGHTRAIGLSAKSPAGVLAALAWADAVMVEYHPLDRSHEAAMAAAAAAGVAVIVKKGLAAGHLPAADSIRFVLANPHVTTMVVGSLHADHMRANLATARQLRPTPA